MFTKVSIRMKYFLSKGGFGYPPPLPPPRPPPLNPLWIRTVDQFRIFFSRKRKQKQKQKHNSKQLKGRFPPQLERY